MKDEYIILNKTAIQQRIEELKKTIDKYAILEARKDLHSKIDNLLSQSTPLIPEIEKSINSGIRSFESNAYEMPELIEEIQQDYISNLKLEI